MASTPRTPRKVLDAGYAARSVAGAAPVLRANLGASANVTPAVLLDQDASARVLTVRSIMPHHVRLHVAHLHPSSDNEPDVIVPACM